MSKKEKIIIGSIAAVVVIGIVLIFIFGRKEADPYNYKLKLEIWGPLDDSYVYSEMFNAYRTIYPQITEITYKKLNYDTYEREVIDAMATGQGPDIFLIHNTWLPSFDDKIVPASAQNFSEQKFRQNFVDVCLNDFFRQGQVWAAPLSVDSLGLYYNKDLFNEKGITSPPKDWEEFIKDARIMTKINSANNEIIQSGVALGLSDNNSTGGGINRATDILSLLMLQNGTEIVDFNKRVALGEIRIDNGAPTSPGVNALEFYSSFARSGSLNYMWNSRRHYSIDAFSEGSVAMMFNYSWQRQNIRDKSPKLNFDAAPIPQFSAGAPINYANYWGFVVAKNKTVQGISNNTRITEAWKLINFMTTKPEKDWTVPKAGLGGGSINPKFDPAINYLMKTSKPAARKDLIEQQKTDSNLSVFALGNLIARSWYQTNPKGNETILNEMINKVNFNQLSVSEAIGEAAAKIGQLTN